MKKLLIVDDEESLINLFINRFSKEYEIHSAVNGAEAVKKCTKEKFDFVMLDVVMPVLDGIEAAKAIKICQQDVKIAIMTGNPNATNMEKIKYVNIDLFIEKPFMLEDVGREIKRLLG